MAGEQSDLSLAKDWIYVFCTVLTLLLSLFTFLCCERRNRIRDRKEAERKANEEKQRDDTEKILALLNNNFVKVVENFQDLKKRVDKLKSKRIDTGLRIFTEFDVFLYMCHDDNCHKFDEPSSTQFLPASPFIPGQMQMKEVSEREKVMSGVKEIMTLFKDFAFLLSLINIPCPSNIKSRFSSEVIAMGNIIHPFVTKAQQQLIHKVVTYFGYTEPDNPIQENEGWFSGCIPWRRRQAMCDPKTEAVVTIEMAVQPNANQKTSEVLETYPGHNAIKTAIPYVENFRYRKGEMYCSVGFGRDYTTNNLMTLLVNGQLIQPVKVKILQEIKALWSGLSGDLLHQLRMILFKQEIDPTCFSKDLLGKFHEDVQPFANPDLEIRQCQVFLYDIHDLVVKLLRDYKHLLKDKSTAIFLKQHAEELKNFVAMKSCTSTEEDRRRRRSSV